MRNYVDAAIAGVVGGFGCLFSMVLEQYTERSRIR